jgi:hypothetical protein
MILLVCRRAEVGGREAAEVEDEFVQDHAGIEGVDPERVFSGMIDGDRGRGDADGRRCTGSGPNGTKLRHVFVGV